MARKHTHGDYRVYRISSDQQWASDDRQKENIRDTGGTEHHIPERKHSDYGCKLGECDPQSQRRAIGGTAACA